MISTGLCSITFRDMSPSDIIDLAVDCKLDGIEWGGDIHVPHGEEALAADVRRKSEAAGIAIPSYGSYYRCDEASIPFTKVLASARALGAPVIRIWAGGKGSEEMPANERKVVVETIRNAVAEAAKNGITLALEYHGGTLTDTEESAHLLLKEVGSPLLKLYWQPRTQGSHEKDLVELEHALPHLSHVHAFHWITKENGEIDRRPFSEGLDEWKEYLPYIRKVEGDRFIFFEFVRDGNPDQLREDAKSLRQLLA